LIDQAISSATNFALAVIAARLLGLSGLGIVAIGFSAYLTLQALHHAFVVEPLVLATTGADPAERDHGTRTAITAVLVVAAASAAILALLGLIVPAPVGRGLLLFAPWAGVAIIQDMWRGVLFRDERGAAAAANDCAWALGMAMVLVPVVLLRHDDIAVVSVWGAGAALAALLGFAQVGLGPIGPRQAIAWLRTHALPLGRWLALSIAVFSVGQQAVVVIVATVLGAQDLGGLRAAQVLFAPTTALIPALGLPILPALTREAANSLRRATVSAARYGLLALTFVAAYMLAAALLRDHLLTWVFGASFQRFRDLIFPYGLAQLFLAQALGYAILLRVTRHGKTLLACQVASSVTSVGLVAALSATYGVNGAAWAIAAGAAVASVSVSIIAWLQARRRPGAVRGGT
jgi:O-antigen/teichoic acid export membrane protein